jgi:integrase
VIFVEFYEQSAGSMTSRRTRISLGHDDRNAAKRKADELAAAFSKPERPKVHETTLDSLFDIYVREVTPAKGAGKQAHDHRAAALFRQCFGGTRKVSTLNRRDWDRFIQLRSSGALRPGNRDDDESGGGVGHRQVAYDLKFLLGVLNWAVLAGDGRGDQLLERNPLKGLRVPKEENPKRALLTAEQYAKLKEIAPRVHKLFPLALVLAHETGHRIGAIRQLRWSDIDFSNKQVLWRGENDKIGMQHRAPLSTEALRALQQARKSTGAIGDAWIFPSPGEAKSECSRHLVRDWWSRAAKLADIPTGARFGWHSLRRKFANDLKSNTPMADLCHLGGWKSPMTVMTVYQQPDEVTMRSALKHRVERRSAG